MAPTLIAVTIALVVGLMMGSSTARAKRARLDYQRTKSLVPAARKLAWEESLRGLKVMATAIAVMVVLAIAMNAIGRQ